MSRIGKMPVAAPAGRRSDARARTQITVKGALGTLTLPLADGRQGRAEGRRRWSSSTPRASRRTSAIATAGTTRALSRTWSPASPRASSRSSTLVGVGYRAQAQGDKLNLSLGFSHPVVHQMPEGIKVETPTQTEIVIKGVDRQAVGQVAAEVRALPPAGALQGQGRALRRREDRRSRKRKKK